MRRISSISMLIVISLLFAAGCEQPAQSTLEGPVVIDMPDNEGAPEQVVQEQPGANQAAAGSDQLETETPVETEIVNIPAEAEGPEIRFEKVVHDYGDIGAGSKHKGEFPFKNVGKGVLIIANVQSTCGCTAPALKKKTYQPGESGEIVVEFHADLRPGKPRKTLYAVSNDPQNPKIALTVKANVVMRVGSDPERLKFFLGDDNEGVQEITLTSLDGAPFSIRNFKATGDTITAEFDPSVEATKFVLKAQVDGEKLKSNLRGNINIPLSHPECPIITIPFDVMPKYTVNPPMVILFDVAPSKPISRKIWILSNYKKPFDVDSVVSKDGSVKEMSKKEIRNGYELMVEIIPPDPNEEEFEYSGKFSIKLTDGLELPIEYRVFYSDTESEGDESDAPTDP